MEFLHNPKSSKNLMTGWQTIFFKDLFKFSVKHGTSYKKTKALWSLLVDQLCGGLRVYPYGDYWRALLHALHHSNMVAEESSLFQNRMLEQDLRGCPGQSPHCTEEETHFSHGQTVFWHRNASQYLSLPCNEPNPKFSNLVQIIVRTGSTEGTVNGAEAHHDWYLE